MKFYRDYADYLAERFPVKMQKLTVNAGFSCPNRDGTVGRGGCTYCNNRTFSPGFAKGAASVAEQLENGKAFFARKYPQMRYLAYFQSYTNTHGDPERLLALYREALAVDGVDGIVIATRPDCVDAPLLERLAELNRTAPVIMEYGAESAHDRTLQAVNRCHTWAQTVEAVRLTRAAGLDVGLHFILGLPGETVADMLATVDAINRLRPDTVKFHQLQIVRGTELARQVEQREIEVAPFTVGQYLDLCVEIVNRLDPAIAIDRFTSSSPAELLIAPRWGLKNHEFVDLLNRRLRLAATLRTDSDSLH